MKNNLFYLCISFLVILSCGDDKNNDDNSGDENTDSLEYLSTVEELTGLLPESLPQHPTALQILSSTEGDEKIGGSRQYLNPDNDQTYAKVAITEYPRTEEKYDSDWSYNESFENDQRKVTATENVYPNVDVYEVLMKDSDMKYTTFYINKRFEIYIETKGVSDVQYHYDIAEPLIDELKDI